VDTAKVGKPGAPSDVTYEIVFDQIAQIGCAICLPALFREKTFTLHKDMFIYQSTGRAQLASE
jgi:hypothetical protein